jgi:glycosyltransferase involved in cell wall biosynthesis
LKDPPVITPHVSIICAFYEAEDFLAEAVESVLSQDHPSFELLLVDDGSTDSSTKIALDFARRFGDKISYLEHEGHRNLGASPSRNAGLRHATGEYVAVIDSDDRWRPRKLSEQLAVFERRPGIGMVCGAVNYWANWSGGRDRLVRTGSRSDTIFAPPSTILWMHPLGLADAPCPSDVLLRRDHLEAVGGFEEEFVGPMQMYEDQALFAKIYLAAPVFFSSKVWLDYRLHEGSCVARVERDGIDATLRARYFDWLETYVEAHSPPEKERILAAIRRERRNLRNPLLGRLRRKWLRRLQSLAVRTGA